MAKRFSNRPNGSPQFMIDATPYATTNTTITTRTGDSFRFEGADIGPNGALDMEFAFTAVYSAAAKIVQINISNEDGVGGVIIHQEDLANSTGKTFTVRALRALTNNTQLSVNASGSTQARTLDLSKAVYIWATVTKATGSEAVALVYRRAVLYPSTDGRSFRL